MVSVVVAALATIAWAVRISRHLHVLTTTVGFPTFADFNIERYYDFYYLAIGAFPLLTLACFVVLNAILHRLWGGPGIATPIAVRPTDLRGTSGRPPVTSLAEPAQRRTVPAAWRVARRCIRLALVGGLLGLELALFNSARGGLELRDVALGATAYGALALFAATVVARGARSGLEPALARVNAVGGALPVLGLALVSQATGAVVLSTGRVTQLDWFPWMVAVPAAVAAAALSLRALRRASGDRGLTAVEVRTLVWVTLPVLVVLLTTRVPHDLPFASFEDGQQVATVNFLRQGLLPWRDFLFIHGLLDDTLKPLVGMTALDNSVWGAYAGWFLLFIPAAYVGLYALGACMAGRNLGAAVMAAFLLLQPVLVGPPFVRFMFWPIVLVLLRVALARRTAPWMMALGGAAVAQAFIAPETAFCIPAVGLAVVGAGLTEWRAGRAAPAHAFRPALWVIAGGGAVGALLLAWLLASGSLKGFVLYYTTFAGDHELEGGIPLSLPSGIGRLSWLYWMLAPVSAVLISMLVLAPAVLRRRRLSVDDWVTLAAAIVSAVYYTKVVGRADTTHVLESYPVALPLLLILAARFLRLAGRGLEMTARRYRVDHRLVSSGLSTVMAALALVALPGGAGDFFDQLAPAHRPHVTRPAVEPKLGLAQIGPQEEGDLHEIRLFMSAYVRPGDVVFDFTNDPGVYYYLLNLNLRPGTVFYHVSAAITLPAQQELIAQLRESRPQLVIFDAEGWGLPAWDGISNQVRHYAVSDYLLSAYRPLAWVGRQLVYVRRSAAVTDPGAVRGLVGRVVTTGLYFEPGHDCNWGTIPNFFAGRPALDASRVALQPPGAGSTRLPSLGRDWSRFHWLTINPPGDERGGEIAISDSSLVSHRIVFRILAGAQRTMSIPIAACAQWYGFGSGPLTVTASAGDLVQSWTLAT